jgi:hypothetical protein
VLGIALNRNKDMSNKKRAWQYGGVIGLALAVALIVSSQSGGSPARKPAQSTQVASAQGRIDRQHVTATGTGLAAADPIGTQRLEGQVLDADDHPVARARVTVDSIPPRVVETEDDGTFAFDRMLAKHYTLVAVAAEGVAGPTTTRLSDRSDPVILRLREGATAEVAVVDGETGRAVAGAKVEVRGVHTPSASTGADGIAVLRQLVPGRWLVVVSAPGYATAFDSLATSGAARTKLAIALARGFTVRGRVIDDAGQPIADAQVWPESASDFYANPDPGRDGTRTTSDGTFVLGGVGRGTYQVFAIAEDYASGASASTVVDGDTAGIVVKLGRGVRLAGRAVYKDRRPATDAVVRATWSGGGRLVHVDKDGRFELDTMPAAAVWVWARDASSTSKPRRIALDAMPAAEALSLELVLDHDGVISGIVVDGRGAPIEGAQVAARRLEVADDAPTRSAPELTDAGGRFTLHGLVAGDYKLTAARDPRQLWSSTAAVMARTGTLDAKLTLETDGAIEGRVALRKGGTPASFSVRVGRRGLPVTFTGGQFKLDAPPGKHAIVIEGAGFAAATVDGVEVKPGAATDVGEITVDRGRVIRGRVVGPSATPAAAAQVLAGAVLTGTGARADLGDDGPSIGGEVKRASANAQGEFVIEGAGSAPLSLVAVSSTGRSSPVSIPAGTDDLAGVTLTISSEARLSGTVRVNGKPARAVVNAQPHASPLAMMTAMTNDGAYAFDHLAPGAYNVAAVTGDPYGGSPFYPHAITLAAGDRATLDLTVAAGPDTLTVQTPGIAAGLVFITTRPGTATAALAMVAELGRQGGGQWAVAPIRDGGAVFRELASGPVRACVIAMPGAADQQAGALVATLFQSGATLAMTCAAGSSSGTLTLRASSGS